MAYGRYSRGRKKKATTSIQKIKYKRPSARNQKNQILAIKQDLNAVKRIAMANTYKTWYYYNVTTNLSSAYNASALIMPVNWIGVFNTPGEERGGKFTGINYKIEYIINAGNESAPINCTTFFAYPRNQKVVSETGGAVADTCSALQNGTDFTVYDGMCLMNKKRWNIVACHRHTTVPLSSTNAVGTTILTDMKPSRRHFTRKLPLKINNRTGEWNTVDSWLLPARQRLHVFCFNNNLGIDLEYPTLNLKILAQGQTSG